MTNPAEFMRNNGLDITSEFVPFSLSRNAQEAHRSLNWKVTLVYKGREILTTDYSAGVAHCPGYKAKMPHHYPYNEKRWRDEVVTRETETGLSRRWGMGGFYGDGTKIAPTAADVFHSLLLDSDVMDHKDFESWASEFGYDTDSRAAEKTYRACLEIGLQFYNGLGRELIEKAREAFQDY